MKAEPLEFPRGVRFPRADEIPAPRDEALARIASARITTGYVQKSVEKVGYSNVFEANVHASKVWDVFRALVEAIVPEAAAPIVGLKEDEPVLGPYTTRAAALGVLEPYREPLQHDGLLEFGVIFQLKGRTEEVFVHPAKWLQIWTNKPHRTIEVLEAHGIPSVPALQFIDEYPRVSETLPYEGHSTGWFPIVERLKAEFKSLPEPPHAPDA